MADKKETFTGRIARCFTGHGKSTKPSLDGKSEFLRAGFYIIPNVAHAGNKPDPSFSVNLDQHCPILKGEIKGSTTGLIAVVSWAQRLGIILPRAIRETFRTPKTADARNAAMKQADEVAKLIADRWQTLEGKEVQYTLKNDSDQYQNVDTVSMGSSGHVMQPINTDLLDEAGIVVNPVQGTTVAPSADTPVENTDDSDDLEAALDESEMPF